MPTNIHSTYKKLITRTKDLIILQTTEDIIHWDMETMMPPKAVEQRSRQLALGNLKNIKGWLAKNVHSHGDLYEPAELIKKITGKKLDAKPYLEYLEEKYGALYGF